MTIAIDLPPQDTPGIAVAGDGACPMRRCIVGGHSGPAETMLRFVIGPDGDVVPDIARRLPGRGIWVDATQSAVSVAVARNLFARAARRSVSCRAEMPQLVERQLFGRIVDLVGLARRAGRAVAGMAKIEDKLQRGRIGLVLIAGDAGKDGRKHLERARQLVFADSEVLGGIFGRDAATYVGIEDDEATGKGFASRIAAAVARWDRYRGAALPQVSN